MNEIISRIALRFSSFALIRFIFSIGRWVVAAFAFNFLNTENFALLVFTISLIEIIRILSDLGLEPFLYLKVGVNKKRNQVWNYLCRIKVFTSFVSFFLIFLIGYFLNQMNLMIAGLLIITGSLITVSQAIIQKNNLVYKIHILGMQAIFIFSILVASLLFVTGWKQYLWSLVAFEFFILILILKYIGLDIIRDHLISNRIKKNHKKSILWILFNKSGYSYFTQLISAISARTDVFIIRPLIGISAQANYSAAFRLTDPIVQIVAGIVLSILVERSSFSTNSNVSNLRRILNSSLYKFTISLSMAIALFSSVASFLISLGLSSPINNLLFIFFIGLAPVRILNQFHSYALMKLNCMNVVFWCTTVLGFTFLITLINVEIYKSEFFVFSLFCFGETLNCLFQLTYLKKKVFIDKKSI